MSYQLNMKPVRVAKALGVCQDAQSERAQACVGLSSAKDIKHSQR